jgi:hypothetical protein
MKTNTLVALLGILALLFTFAPQSGVAARNVQANWEIVPSPNLGDQQNALKAVFTLSANDIWAVGEYNSGVPPFQTGRRTLAMHWDGSTWQIIPSPNPSWSGLDLATFEDVVAVNANNVWFVGYSEDFGSLRSNTLIAHWDGAHWRAVLSPNPAGINLPNKLFAAAAVSANNIYAVGSMSMDDQALILNYNGSRWNVVNNACGTGLRGITAISASDIWAVGDTTICHFDGTAWTVVPSPQPRPEYYEISYPLQDIVAVSPTDIWAVGARILDYGQYIVHLSIFEHWNGSQWTLMDPPLAQILYGVEAVASNDVWAAGTTGSQAVVLHWNGASWTSEVLPNPGNGSYLRDITLASPSNLWSVGSYYTTTEQTLILRGSAP